MGTAGEALRVLGGPAKVRHRDVRYPWAVFEVVARDGLARTGRLATAHGVVETPALLPVVHPERAEIPPRELASRFGVRAVMTNAYILYRGGRKDDAVARGVHAVLGFDGPVMTDSGAFQSHVYGDVAVGNAEIVEFQRAIGSDLGTMLDVFSEPEHSRSRAGADVDETLRRAAEAATVRGTMALVGAVQGGLHADERERCARELSKLDVAVAAIGGVVPLFESYRFRDLVRVIVASKRGLSPALPVHLFGAGHPMVFSLAVLLGCDLFDSASYVKYARDGRMMFPDGTRHAADLVESPCECPTCAAHPMSELRASPRLLAEHNLYVSLGEMRRVREAVRDGGVWELAEVRARAHPSLLDGLRELRRHVAWLERFEPVSRTRAVFYTGAETIHRPIFHRYRARLIERYRPPRRRALAMFPEGPRPFGRHRASAISRILSESNAHVLVKSAFGPVPIELDEMYPIGQALVPTELDLEVQEALEVFARHFIAGAGYEFGAMWEGDATLESLQAHDGRPGPADLDAWRVRAVADMQFGRGAADALFSNPLKIVKSRKTGRIRNVMSDGRHVVSMRAHDGLFTLKLAGARRLHAAFSPPSMRVIVDAETAPFYRAGANVFAKFVRGADPDLRPGDEVIVVDPADAIIATGQARMNAEELRSFRRGVAVRVREGVPLSP